MIGSEVHSSPTWGLWDGGVFPFVSRYRARAATSCQGIPSSVQTGEATKELVHGSDI